jgi:GT2 family glycosyltransferase
MRNFAAFIMTFERPDILLSTISKIKDQSSPPDKILIVDNSFSDGTEVAINKLNDVSVQYYKMGYNAGPAGAAKTGLQILTEEDYDWIFWGDDDDPPTDRDAFKRLFSMADRIPDTKIGAIGTVGGFFNRYTARVSVVKNEQVTKEFTKVDQIPGGHNFIVNSQVVKEGVLPTAKLFFGFEELDFCLKMKNKGFNLYIDGERILNNRIKAGYSNPSYKWKSKGFGKKGALERNYYSIRNMNHILYSNKNIIALLYSFSKNMLKAIFGFTYGLNYGRKNLSIIFIAYKDTILNRYGKRTQKK